MKKILLTGGDGFLARSFRAHIEDRGHQLVKYNRTQLDLTNADLVQQCLNDEQFDVVIHTATYDAAPKHSLKDANKVLEINLKMFFNLARNRDKFGKMLYFGSGAEFGRENWVENMSESMFDQKVPIDQYGYSKYLMTQFALQTENIFNLRLFGVYGELDDWRYRFLSNVCCHAIINQSIKIYQNSYVDFLYIKDLARIVLWFIENQPKRQVYNVCRGKTYEFVELARLVAEMSSRSVEITVINKNIKKFYGGTNSLLLSEMSSFEFTPLDVSLKNMMDWYEENKASINVDMFHF